MTRFLLCRPMGGLNDTLCVLDTCWRYAERFDRHLIIDARRSGLRDHFGRYFASRGNQRAACAVDMAPTERTLARLDGLSAHPAAIQGRIQTYDIEWSSAERRFVEKTTKVPIGFALDQAHPEHVLVYHHCRREQSVSASIATLARLTLSHEVRTVLNERLARLSGPYSAIHVRNTDYRTDYVPFVMQARNRLAHRRVLICSDSRHCIEVMRKLLDGFDIMTVSDIPDIGEAPLHESPAIDSHRANLDALTDLFALAGSAQLLFANIDRGFPSGYSQLAEALQQRPDLRGQLLGDPSPVSKLIARLRHGRWRQGWLGRRG